MKDNTAVDWIGAAALVALGAVSGFSLAAYEYAGREKRRRKAAADSLKAIHDEVREIAETIHTRCTTPPQQTDK